MKAESVSKGKRTFPGSVGGTYLNVEVAPPWEPDRFDYPPDLRYSVLYLLPSGSFAWFDYWPGFHYGRCAGRFTRNGATLELQGRGSVQSDCPSADYSGRLFDKQVTLRQVQDQRVLVGLRDKEHLFIGWGIHIPFTGLGQNLFPTSWAALQDWIDRFVDQEGKGECSSLLR